MNTNRVRGGTSDRRGGDFSRHQRSVDTRDPIHDKTSRRGFLRALGAGLILAVTADLALAQVPPGGGGRRGGGGRGGFGRGGGAKTVSARLHIGQDGIITVMTGKVECGQGSRAELTQAAAEELSIAPDRLRLIMADTGLVPDDGGTAGSGTTPGAVPSVRRGCAAARELLAAFAAKQWGTDPKSIQVRDGKAVDPNSDRTLAYADLAADKDAAKSLDAAIPADVALTAVENWKVLGTPVARPNGRDLVTGAHQYPSDITRPGMVYGKVLRAPSYGAKLTSIDVGPAKAMKGVTVVQDGDFVGVTATNSYLSGQALGAIADTAKWEIATSPYPSSAELYDHLKSHARGGVPANPFADVVAKAAKSLKATYHVAYVQHCPMEPRAAVAEWQDDKLTVWTGTQMPFGVRGELARTFGLADDGVRVIVPDVGGGFGGKHSGECAVEAARLARSAGKPVQLRWTREEEFTWAYFRPAGVIEAEASLDDKGMLTSWSFVNINSGGNEVQSPYRVPKSEGRFIQSAPPLRHGSYRALAVTANTFGRESFMDEMAHAAGMDPLAFRLAHLDAGRLRDVLQEAATRFRWAARSQLPTSRMSGHNVGVGLACGSDKGSFVAACARVAVAPDNGSISVTHVCQVFDCGKVINPGNLLTQVKGAILMGLGPALREEMQFEKGKILNAALSRYAVPRFEDVPELDIHLLDRPDVPSAGAGETPIIAIAPAIANAVFAASGVRVRQMPMGLVKG
jgi:isoquinoline 1-oxidoreductase